MDNSNKINFLRFLKYREEGYDISEIEEIYKKQRNCEIVDVVYNCIRELDNVELMEVIWGFAVTEDLYYLIEDLADFWDIDREELYWL